MGVLDEAIREHLELKRRRGADAGEIARQEREVLGAAGQAQAGAGEPTSHSGEVPAPASHSASEDDATRVVDPHAPSFEAEPRKPEPASEPREPRPSSFEPQASEPKPSSYEPAPPPVVPEPPAADPEPPPIPPAPPAAGSGFRSQPARLRYERQPPSDAAPPPPPPGL